MQVMLNFTNLNIFENHRKCTQYILLKIAALQCSVSCGGGRQRREPRCVDHNSKQHDRQHCDQKALVLSKSCNEDPCPDWVIENWTGVRDVFIP